MRPASRALLVTGILACGYMWAQTAAGADTGLLADIAATFANIKTYIQNLVEQTNTPILRTGIIFILGVCMSLTPCIYPMIPITLGTLQAAAGKAKHNTFVLALLYTCGIAITFAILGLCAAFGGAQIGTLLGNPWFVVPFVIFLGYLAFAMMGLYELYIPRFLQQQTTLSRTGGAYLSAFIFGMLNGSVASPCVSPGLIMVLRIVAVQQSIMLGFVYLFAFGFGLGLPLLIIGSFSNAAHIMPKAGIWMLEVKRIFGILLLSMAWYYASNLMAYTTSLWLAAGACISVVLVYLYTIANKTSRWHMAWSVCMILAALISAGVCSVYAITYEPETTAMTWVNQYEEAKAEAQNNNALLLIDFGATWCPSCQKINTHLIQSSALQAMHYIVIAEIDCTYSNNAYVIHMKQKFNVDALPLVLLVDPDTERVIARWHGELAEYTPEEFVRALERNGARSG